MAEANEIGLPEGFTLDAPVETPPPSGFELDEPVAREAEDIPEFRALPPESFPTTLWKDAMSLFKDPEGESAKAVQALVDSEALGINASTAFRLQDTIKRGVEFHPKAAMRRSTTMERIGQSWGIGGAENQMGETANNFAVTGDIAWLHKAEEMEKKIPGPEEIFVAESRLEENFRSAAKLLPMTVDIAKEAGWKGVVLGTGFGLVSMLAGQPELVPAMAMSGFYIGGAEGLFEGALRKETGFAVMELMKLKDEEGNKIEPDIARAAAFGIGFLNAGLEVASVKILFDTVPGLDKIFSRAILETVKSKTVKKGLLDLGALYAGTVAKETGVEVAQESNNILLGELSKNLNNAIKGTTIKQADADEIMNRLFETASEAAKGFSVIAAPGVLVQAGQAVLTRPQRTELKAKQKEIKEVQKEEDIVRTTEALTDIGLPQEEARIEAERIATQVEKVREVFRKEEEVTPKEAIVQDVSSQLEAAGVEAGDALVQAEVLYGRSFEVLAKRAGVPVEELFEKFGPTIRGAEEVKITKKEKETLEQAENKWVMRHNIIDRQDMEETVEKLQKEGLFDVQVKQGKKHKMFSWQVWVKPKIEILEQATKPPRGRITIGPGGVTIDLLETADQSTFVHETGHLYVRMLQDLATQPGAPENLVTDYQTVIDWLGADPAAPLTVPQQEKWARGFEAYLREGKAPNSTLTAAFTQFKEWLTGVYKTALELGVELTPEVRVVMDNLLVVAEDPDNILTDAEFAMVDLVAEGRGATTITDKEIQTIVPKYKPLPPSKIKGQIRDATGIKKTYALVREDKAAFAAWKKAEQASRVAFREGKKEGFEKAKTEMRKTIARVKEKAQKKVDKIHTEKQKLQKRKKQVRLIIDFLDLTDAQAKKLAPRRDMSLMTDYEFKLFKDNMLIKAEQVQTTALAKARVSEIIQRKRLGRVENYRRALELPPLSKMNQKQLDEWADALDKFADGDVFLSKRQLELVDRTDIPGIKTWREARERLADELNIEVEDLTQIAVSELDKFRWDTALAERNPFYRMLVTETSKQFMIAEATTHRIENEVFKLARASEKSRELGIVGRLIPQDKQIIDYLEAPADMKEEAATNMTPEQIDFAHYIQEYMGESLDYLIKVKSLKKGRENYFVHIRRSFLEDVKEDSLVKATMNIFKNNQLDEMTFNILDGDTGNILPLEKHFQFSMQRTGTMAPTYNITKAFLIYVKTLEKKKALDAVTPKLDMYAQALTPPKMTERGLEVDRSVKKFVNQFINNKKGRQIGEIIKQGGKVDLTIRALRTFTTLLDLGFSLTVGTAALVGETAANFQALGTKSYARGKIRKATKKGKAIIKKYEAFTGRSAWQEFTAPGKEIGERLMEGAFGLFHEATVRANQDFLLGIMTQEEYNLGEISAERLAEIKIEMGRYRVIPGSRSLVGSTSAGGAFTQYKTWAVPIARTLAKNADILVKDLRAKPVGEALTTREAREIYRFISTSAMLLMAWGLADDAEDGSFLGQLYLKIQRESLTLLQALSPVTFTSVRIIDFVAQLAGNLKSLASLEENKNKPGLKGLRGLTRQFTPSIVRQLDIIEDDVAGARVQ